MLAIDVAVVVGAVALGLGTLLGLRAYWRKTKPEVRGEENARAEAAERARCCHFCKKPTDPAVDLFINPYWYHRGCNRNEGTP